MYCDFGNVSQGIYLFVFCEIRAGLDTHVKSKITFGQGNICLLQALLAQVSRLRISRNCN